MFVDLQITEFLFFPIQKTCSVSDGGFNSTSAASVAPRMFGNPAVTWNSCFTYWTASFIKQWLQHSNVLLTYICCVGGGYSWFYVGTERARSLSTPGTARLHAVSSAVRWRQCTQYVLQPLCGSLLCCCWFVSREAERSYNLQRAEVKPSVENSEKCPLQSLCFSCFIFLYL